jgi:hypothetical protein
VVAVSYGKKQRTEIFLLCVFADRDSYCNNVGGTSFLSYKSRAGEIEPLSLFFIQISMCYLPPVQGPFMKNKKTGLPDPLQP